MTFAEQHDEKKKNVPHALDILYEMHKEGLEDDFINCLMEYCHRYEGLKELMQMWIEESEKSEKELIINDLQDALDDIVNAPKKPEERPYLQYENLHEIQKDISEFKQKLREETDRQGGINELARKTGIPQPSLSRFFSSTSMPRRTTLYKIAKALCLPESAIGFKWTR